MGMNGMANIIIPRLGAYILICLKSNLYNNQTSNTTYPREYT